MSNDAGFSFERELQRLLDSEGEVSDISDIAALTEDHRRLMTGFGKQQTDISMQVEEIFDIVRGDAMAKELLNEEKARTSGLVSAVIGLMDIIEDFCGYARDGGDTELERQALLMHSGAGKLLDSAAITRIGAEGETLDPALHSVQAAAASEYPKESVARVLRSGYRYLGAVIRKAAVVVGTGENADEQNSRD